MKKNIVNIIKPTEGELDALKQQYGTLSIVQVNTSDTEYTFVFKPIDRKTLSAAMVLGKDNQLDVSYTLAANTLVWGDERLFDVADIFLGIVRCMNEIFNCVTSNLKKR